MVKKMIVKVFFWGESDNDSIH